MPFYEGVKCEIMEICVNLTVLLTVQGMKSFQFQGTLLLIRLSVHEIRRGLCPMPLL